MTNNEKLLFKLILRTLRFILNKIYIITNNMTGIEYEEFVKNLKEAEELVNN